MMKQKKSLILWVTILGILLLVSQLAISKETPQEWVLSSRKGLLRSNTLAGSTSYDP